MLRHTLLNPPLPAPAGIGNGNNPPLPAPAGNRTLFGRLQHHVQGRDQPGQRHHSVPDGHHLVHPRVLR